MKKIAMICVTILFVAVSAHGTMYDSEAGWNGAVSGYNIVTEDFSTAGPSFDDFTISSEWGGSVIGGEWYDRVDTEISGVIWETTIEFDDPIYGFGGYWDLNGPTGPGEEIDLIINGSVQGLIPNSAAGDFYGVAGIGWFDTVVIRGSMNQIGPLGFETGWVETFTLDDAVIATPVPGAVLLGILGLSVAGVKLRKHA